MGISRTTNFINAAICCLITVFGYIASTRMVWADDGDDDDIDGISGLDQEQIDTLFAQLDEVLETVTFYASLSAILLILFGLSLALRLPRWSAYIVLTIVSTVWLVFFEHELSGQIWTGIVLDFPALVVMGFGVASLHMIVASLAIIPSERFGWMKYVLFACVVMVWIGLVFNWPDASEGIPAFYYITVIVACLSHAAAIPSFLALRGATTRKLQNGIVFSMVAAAGILSAVLFGEVSEGIDLIFLLRLALLTVVVFYILFFVRYVMAILFERDEHAKGALEAARRDAEKTKELLEAEKKYSRAQAAARMHTMRLATASHDIRQPIASLRATMDAVARHQSDDTRAQLSAAFDYLDDLAKSYLDTGDPDEPIEDREFTSNDGREVVETQMIIATLDRMFRKETEARSLSLIVSTDSARLYVQPLVLTRVLSNLLTNAIKYTDRGNVALRGLAEETGFRFRLANDADLPSDIDEKDLFDPLVKGSSSGGSGLGLSIVDTLTKRNGLQLTWANEPGHGTVFEVVVPYANTTGPQPD